MKRRVITIVIAAAMLAMTACGNAADTAGDTQEAPVGASVESTQEPTAEPSRPTEAPDAKATSDASKTDRPADGKTDKADRTAESGGKKTDKSEKGQAGSKAADSSSEAKTESKVPTESKGPAEQAPSAAVPEMPASQAPAGTGSQAKPGQDTPAQAPGGNGTQAPVEPSKPQAPVPTPTPQAHAHSYDGGTVTTAATCGSDGVMTYTCSCGATKTEAIPATGQHSPVDVWYALDTHADCTTPEYHHVACSVCGAQMGEVSGPAWGHSVAYREREVVMDDPCHGVRILEPYCTTCGTTEGIGPCHDEPVELAHDWHEVQDTTPYDVDPETGEWLYRTIQQCSRCGQCQ